MQQVLLEFEARASNPAAVDYRVYNSILDNVRGMVYYATPHGGSHLADLVKRLYPLLWCCMLQPGRMMDLLDTLGEQGNYSSRLFVNRRDVVIPGLPPHQVFRTSYLFLCEQQFMPPLTPELVVPYTSATLYMRQGLGDTDESIDDDHSGVCKPGSLQDPKFGHLRVYLGSRGRAENDVAEGPPAG